MSKKSVASLAKEQLLYPLEQMMQKPSAKKSLSIGIPKELTPEENRIVLTPEAVSVLVNNGHEIKIESGAGETAKFSDREYSEAGAEIKFTPQEVFDAEIVLKVEPPSLSEIEYIKPKHTLISALQMAKLTPEYIMALKAKKITSIAFELVEDKGGTKPIIRAMSEIAGSSVLLIAAEYLNSNNKGKGIILGGITGVPPASVVIIGAGTVAEYAARTAMGLGAEVKIFDRNVYKLRRIKYLLGHQVYTCIIDTATMGEAISRADVVIGAMRAEEGQSPCVVTDEMVAHMKPNSIIVDVSIDQGGCFETSELRTLQKPIFKKHDVIHYCVPNIASRVSLTSSIALSNIFTPYLLDIAKAGGLDEIMFKKDWFMKGIYTYKGNLTNRYVSKKLGIPHRDLNLFRASNL